MKKFVLLFFVLFSVITFFTQNVFAEIKLPAIFGDNMVLQQKSDAAIWGLAEKNATVRITTTWNKASYSVKADNSGKWKANVKTPPAGGPYSIEISDGQKLVLKNVLIGEVWLCSGQSNMEMPMKGFRNQPILGATEAIAVSTNNNIRLITVKRASSVNELYDFSGEWKLCTPENVSEFSATAYYFGSLISKALNVPVGLINSSWGGTRIEPWISENGFKNFDWVKLPEKKPVENLSQQTPTVLYNAMIKPIVGFQISGVIWYQGESNRNEAQKYQLLMTGLISNWRNEWGIGEFPFYYVQIAPFDYGIGGINSAFLREAQLKASTVLPNTGMACIMDAGEKDCIHPANKEAAGKRLAFIALSNKYGIKGINTNTPVLKNMEIQETGVIKLTFDNAPNGLTTFGKELECFEIAGANKRFYPAKASITNTGITLFTSAVPTPVAVRYAFKDFIVGDLFSIEGIPVSSFRTDDWQN